MKISASKIKSFNHILLAHYRTHGRSFTWRKTKDPYHILVSEIMLQQTQTTRVITKYAEFLKKFPTIRSLARASMPDLLKTWQGLGYNRRAIYLKKTAEVITKEYAGKFPKDTAALLSLPGIGQSTAGALQAFCWNMPSIFIETNIRTVFIHFFFNETSSKVSDTDIRALIEKTIDRKDPRPWYYALYDYGTMLKALEKGKKDKLHTRSSHYKKQSKFAGSNRELRSNILKMLLASKKALTSKAITAAFKKDAQMIVKNLEAMAKEGLIRVVAKDLYKA